MKGVERLHIDIDWDKMKSLHTEVKELHVRCMNKKWSPFKEWEQGFDSDCFAHCSEYDICTKHFYDERCHLKNHFKKIIIPCEEKLYCDDKEFKLEELP